MAKTDEEQLLVFEALQLVILDGAGAITHNVGAKQWIRMKLPANAVNERADVHSIARSGYGICGSAEQRGGTNAFSVDRGRVGVLASAVERFAYTLRPLRGIRWR